MDNIVVLFIVVLLLTIKSELIFKLFILRTPKIFKLEFILTLSLNIALSLTIKLSEIITLFNNSFLTILWLYTILDLFIKFNFP